MQTWINLKSQIWHSPWIKVDISNHQIHDNNYYITFSLCMLYQNLRHYSGWDFHKIMILFTHKILWLIWENAISSFFHEAWNCIILVYNIQVVTIKTTLPGFILFIWKYIILICSRHHVCYIWCGYKLKHTHLTHKDSCVYICKFDLMKYMQIAPVL